MAIYFVTSNEWKFREASEILEGLVKKRVKINELQSVEVRDVVLAKVNEAYKEIRKPVIVEDTGLYLDALDGFPGALIKLMEDRMGLGGICRLVKRYGNRKATAKTIIAFYDGRKVRLFESSARGTIISRPRGKMGFGFDFIFLPNGSKKVMAEMNIHEKNLFSARGKSFRKLKRYLVR